MGSGATPVSEASTPLLHYVKALENRDNRARGEQVLTALRSLGLEPQVQESRCLRVRNLVVDFSPGPARLLFSAHYDPARGSPGANDNASGVAVLLGLCRELRHSALPVRIVFFDREETWLRTPVLRLGVLGSLYYVWKNGCRDLQAVFNLEFCGSGDLLAVWPVKKRDEGVWAVREVTATAARLGVPVRVAHLPWLLFSSDHQSFRLRGLRSSVTLSLMPASQVPTMEKLLSGLSLRGLVLRRRPAFPEPLCFIHTREDTSSRLSEDSLQLMLSLVRELAQCAEA